MIVAILITNKNKGQIDMKQYFIKNMLSGLVTVVMSKNRYEAINKGIKYFGVNQVRLCNR